MEGDGAQQQNYVVRSETDQKQGHHSHSQVAHLLFLMRLEASTGLNVGKNGSIGEDQDGKGDNKADANASVAESRNYRWALAGLKAAAFSLGSIAFRHDEDGRVTQAHHNVDRKCYKSCDASLTKTVRLDGVDHSHITVDRHAAQQEDADVHVVEEHKASHFAGQGAPGPHVVLIDVHRPQRQREEVGEVAHGQAEQVDAEDVLTTHLVEGEVDRGQVGWQANDKNHNVEHHQRNAVIFIGYFTGPILTLVRGHQDARCHGGCMHHIWGEIKREMRMRGETQLWEPTLDIGRKQIIQFVAMF